MATNLVQIENEQEIKQRLDAERTRLRKIAGLDQSSHFHRPVERAFTADERSRVTILLGGFTWKHEDLIRAVFQGCGYRCEKLPVPDVPAFQTSSWRRKAFLGSRFSTTMSSSRPAPAAPAVSACTKPNIALH